MKTRMGVIIAALAITCAFGRLTRAAPQSASAAQGNPSSEHAQAGSSAAVQPGQQARPQSVAGTRPAPPPGMTIAW